MKYAVFDGDVWSDEPDGTHFNGDVAWFIGEDLLVAGLDFCAPTGELIASESGDFALSSEESGECCGILTVVCRDKFGGGFLQCGDPRIQFLSAG